MAFITINTRYPLYDGIPLTFRAPCDSKDADGLLVNGTKYYLRDANAEDITGINRLFATGAYVSVTVDTVNKYAYITNAVTNYGNTFAGEIIETTRTDLGDRWLLCNGDIVPEGAYPKLRDVLLYNTEWRKVAPFVSYPEVRAMPKAGQWAFIKVKGKTAVLYDANTDTYTQIACPTINTERKHGIFGLTHDGDRYILGVNEYSSDDVKDKVHLFVSSDLVSWTDAHQFTMFDYDEPYDLTFDGVNVLVATNKFINSNSSYYYIIYVYGTDKELTTTKKFNGQFQTEYLLYFSILPNGYWAVNRDGSESCSVYRAGTMSTIFSFSYNGRIAFFNDKYWIGAPADNKYVSDIETYNLETSTKKYLSVKSLVGSTDTLYLRGVEYDKNTNEWMLYISNSGGSDPYYIAYISADADPSDVAQYRTVRVASLPDLHNVQMAPDRSKMTSGNLLRDPNTKYLPTHSGDTLKYIYTG